MLAVTILCPSSLYAGEKTDNGDVGATLLHHILDRHEWQPIPGVRPLPLQNIQVGEVSVPFSLFALMLCLNAAILISLFVGAFRGQRIIPTRIGSMLEPLVFFVRDALVYPAMGEELGKRWLPFFYTLFFFILCANILGIIPLFSTTTGNLSVTTALALIIFVAILTTGFRKKGFIGFFTSMIPEGVPLPIGIFLLLIEIPSLIIRSGVLSIRLFANMIAGHMVIFSLLLLIFLVHPLVSAVSVPMALFSDLLEVLVAIIQAVVFTTLSAIYIALAQTHH